MNNPPHKWRDVCHKFVDERINPMPKDPAKVARDRNLVLIGMLLVSLVYLLVMVITGTGEVMESDGQRVAREASIIEGQQKPEGHGR